MKKKRLDVLLVERNLVDSREKAKRTIMAGLVFSGQERLGKAGMKVDVDIPLRVKQDLHPYVSRGGLKLEKALREFSISTANRVFIDRSEEHTSELQSRGHIVCRLLLEK